MVCTVSKSAKSTERTMVFGIKEGTRGLLEEASYLYTVDGAPCHMHTCICALLLSLMLYMYVSPPNTTPPHTAKGVTKCRSTNPLAEM